MNNTPQPLLPKRSAGRGKGSGVEENPQRGGSLIDDVIPLGDWRVAGRCRRLQERERLPVAYCSKGTGISS